MTTVHIENGKYTFTVENGVINIFRCGVAWVLNFEGPGSKAIMGLIFELEKARDELRELKGAD